MPITTCVFDAYGTLFDVAAAAREVSTRAGNSALAAKWEQVARDWRLKQLQYTWLRSLTGHHADFWEVTKNGLDFALEAAGLDDNPELREDLLAAYWELSAYKEAPLVLARLKSMGLHCAILSNGSPDMLQGAVESAGIGIYLDAVLSVEEVGVYKPHRRVYELVGHHFGCQPAEVLFVSANGWDAAGGAAFGFHTAWVNRAGEPVDRLPGQPKRVVADLAAVPALVEELA